MSPPTHRQPSPGHQQNSSGHRQASPGHRQVSSVHRLPHDGHRKASFDNRGVSEVLGVALLIGIVLTGATAIVLAGGNAIDRSQSEIEIRQAQHAMTQFDSQASRVALQGTDAQRVDMGLRGTKGSLDVDPDDGWIRVTTVDMSSGEHTDVVNESLGAMVYEHGDTTIAYQGGGVWRSDADATESGSVMISRPEFHYHNDTLSMPIITTDRGGSVHSDVTIATGGNERHFPNESAGLTNRIDDSMTVVTVESDYYEAWGRYFEDETSGTVQYDHDAGTVTVTFLSMPDTYALQDGIVATAGQGNVSLHGTGAYVSSYNSSTNEYDTRDGSLVAAGDVNLWGNSEIAGDVRSGSEFEIHAGASTVDGDVYWTDGFENQGAVTGTDEQIDGVPSIPPITEYVTGQVQGLAADNDNEDVPSVIDESDQLVDQPGTLGAGQYYFERLHLTSNEELVIDTTGGDVVIGVRDWVGIDEQAGVTVVGDGDVHLYVEGQSTVDRDITGAGDHVPETEWNLYLDKGAEVSVPDRNASQLTIYGTEDFTGGIGGPQGTTLEGTVYAPAGYAGPGYVYVMQADVYGAVVTGDLTLNQFGSIHYDHALKEESVPLAPSMDRLAFLYASTHGIEVSDG